jgi:hypothetical protein
MGRILHGSATTTEAVGRAIQHSHVWTALADQGLFVVMRGSRVRSCLRPVRAAVMAAGPDGFRWFVCLIKRTSFALRLCCRLHEPVLVRSHHNVVTPDSVIA